MLLLLVLELEYLDCSRDKWSESKMYGSVGG